MARTISRVLLLLITCAVMEMPAHVLAGEPPPQAAEILAPLLPAVVNIEAITTRGQHPYYFWGSGFFVDPSGVIVTNRHVVLGADRIIVTGRNLPPQHARLIHVSDLIDLALLKINVGHPVAELHFGDSDSVRVGDPVFVIGNPLGVGESVTAGVVSALNRNIRETAYDDFIQTDAAINHGNSGGPLIDANGRVIGIATALDSSPHNTGSVGVGFALPAHDAQFIVDQVLRSGAVQAGWAGLQVQELSQALADGLGLENTVRGVVVASVEQGGPAATAGLVPGDVILRLDDRPIDSARDFRRAIAESPVGRTLTLMALHSGVMRSLSLVTGAYPKSTALAAGRSELPPALRVPVATPADPGMRLADLTPARRAQFELGATEAGVLVTEVNPDGPAADAGIATGDVILQVRQRSVATPAEVRRDLLTLAQAQVEHAALLVRGKNGAHWVVLRLAIQR
jgi:serine protease Do